MQRSAASSSASALVPALWMVQPLRMKVPLQLRRECHLCGVGEAVGLLYPWSLPIPLPCGWSLPLVRRS